MSKIITIALAGNPNSGKTTIFNAITGARQHVGNWPGVTVEKKEGVITYKNKKIHVVDLPGTYSLTALSEDETVARNFIMHEDRTWSWTWWTPRIWRETCTWRFN